MLIYSNVRRLIPVSLLVTITLLLVGLSSGAALSDATSSTSELVTVGESHSCALKPNGSITCWGDEADGKLIAPAGFYYQISAGYYHTCGLNTAGDAVCWGKVEANRSAEAEIIPGPFIQVSAGSYYTCALKETGATECWGTNHFGEVANKPGPYNDIATGVDHTCGVKANGDVECWGRNNFGQSNSKSGSYIQVSAGEFHTCALAESGAVDCWGSNLFEQAESKTGPYSMISAGANYTCALSGSGFDCWGLNAEHAADSQLGTFSRVSAGVFHTCALEANGTIDCWGLNTSNPTTQPGLFGPYIPETTLGAPLPPALTNNDDASFSFSSPDPAATFECRLDNGNWAACASPKAYTNLPDGAHTFRVRSVSPPGNVDITPPSHIWTIDTAPPDTTITAKPPALTNSPDAIFQFTSEPGATFECRLDGGGWSSCASPKNYTDLDDGDHNFEVRATDAAGNVDPAAASAKWTIDATPPEVMITEAPSGVTDQTTATIAFSGEAGAAFRCRLDNLVEIEPCDSPQVFTDLDEGAHTFTVWATDDAGNEASDSATWIISFDKLTFLPFVAR